MHHNKKYDTCTDYYNSFRTKISYAISCKLFDTHAKDYGKMYSSTAAMVEFCYCGYFTSEIESE